MRLTYEWRTPTAGVRLIDCIYIILLIEVVVLVVLCRSIYVVNNMLTCSISVAPNNALAGNVFLLVGYMLR